MEHASHRRRRLRLSRHLLWIGPLFLIAAVAVCLHISAVKQHRKYDGEAESLAVAIEELCRRPQGQGEDRTGEVLDQVVRCRWALASSGGYCSARPGDPRGVGGESIPGPSRPGGGPGTRVLLLGAKWAGRCNPRPGLQFEPERATVHHWQVGGDGRFHITLRKLAARSPSNSNPFAEVVFE